MLHARPQKGLVAAWLLPDLVWACLTIHPHARRGCAGKTTFIQNMFAAYAQNPSLSVNDASAPTAKEDFVSDPEKLCTEIVVRDQQNQVAFHYRVQDSPGELCLEVVVEDPSSDTDTHRR